MRVDAVGITSHQSSVIVFSVEDRQEEKSMSFVRESNNSAQCCATGLSCVKHDESTFLTTVGATLAVDAVGVSLWVYDAPQPTHRRNDHRVLKCCPQNTGTTPSHSTAQVHHDRASHGRNRANLTSKIGESDDYSDKQGLLLVICHWYGCPKLLVLDYK